jgi:UDP-N-acetylglucosamine 4,6-dehydratase
MKFSNKNLLITGGTGSFGRAFAKHLIDNYDFNKIIIFSRDELKQFEMQSDKNYNRSNVRFFIGDVRDKDRLNFAMNENVDVVIHTAALKQVPATEYNPFEAIKTNILGAQNLIECCLEKNIKKIIALSTDKAAAPINLYGATKLTSDKLFVNSNHFKGNKRCQFSVVRYGNVMGSRGSVIPIFLKQKIDKNKFTVTDIEMTRFNITLNHAANFVLMSLNKMKGGEIFVPKIPSYKILDLLKAINPNPKYSLIGIRPGEKLHEELITKSDSFNVDEYKNHYIINPTYRLKKTKPKKLFEYNSENNKNFLSVKEIKKLIETNKKDFE